MIVDISNENKEGIVRIHKLLISLIDEKYNNIINTPEIADKAKCLVETKVIGININSYSKIVSKAVSNSLDFVYKSIKLKGMNMLA
jgi:hypothetical protein